MYGLSIYFHIPLKQRNSLQMLQLIFKKMHDSPKRSERCGNISSRLHETTLKQRLNTTTSLMMQNLNFNPAQTSDVMRTLSTIQVFFFLEGHGSQHEVTAPKREVFMLSGSCSSQLLFFSINAVFSSLQQSSMQSPRCSLRKLGFPPQRGRTSLHAITAFNAVFNRAFNAAFNLRVDTQQLLFKGGKHSNSLSRGLNHRLDIFHVG